MNLDVEMESVVTFSIEAALNGASGVRRVRSATAVGLAVVSTPLNSARRYFKDEAMVRFSEFDGRSFGESVVSWFSERPAQWNEPALRASERVRRELDWRAICRKAVDFVEKIQQGSSR
jgi:glycosyltransferase involved in cell wall biosynthesis